MKGAAGGMKSIDQHETRTTGATLQAARKAATERYGTIAELLKREAGIKRHYAQKSISGVAWPGLGLIVAPEGSTRRQLYVLAHECAHVLLHSTPSAAIMPGHMKEHEAEVYAHRAFKRYGLEVPEKSSRWARAYVGQWIMKDKKAGLAICLMAMEFAVGRRDPFAPLAAVDGHPKDDFSKALDRNVGRALKVVAKAEADKTPVTMSGELVEAWQVRENLLPPNAFGTCTYFVVSADGIGRHSDHKCAAHGSLTTTARAGGGLCNHGTSWRVNSKELVRLNGKASTVPASRGFWARLGDVIIERLSKRR
jgi:hypothetical protein